MFLLGHVPLSEAVHFLQTQTLEGARADVATLADRWRAANAAARRLVDTEAGAADGPPTADLPPELHAHGQRVLADPLVREAYGITPCEIKLVELDRLVVHQRTVTLDYVRELAAMLPLDSSDEDVFDFALPLDRRYDPPARVAPIQGGPNGPQAWAMLSPSTDYRVLQTTLLDPSQISGLDPTGAPTQVVAVVIGYGANLLSALQVGNRLILHNGSHRAFTLRQAGRTHAPMLVQTIPPGEEAEHLPDEVLENAAAYLTAPRPPLLRDYFDDQLRVVVHVPRKTRQIRVAVNYEEGFAPGQ